MSSSSRKCNSVDVPTRVSLSTSTENELYSPRIGARNIGVNFADYGLTITNFRSTTYSVGSAAGLQQDRL